MTALPPGATFERIELAEESEFELGGMTVNPAERAVVMNGQRRELQPRVMQVLVALAKARPAVVSRDRLVEQCWKGRVVGDDALNRVILSLRHLAQEFTPQPFTIETVPRVGHRLVEAPAGTSVGSIAAAPRRRGRPPLAALIAVVVGAALALAILRPWEARARVPTVLVTAAGKDATSLALARDLAVKLGSLQTAQSKSMRLVDQADGSARQADLILNVAHVTGLGTKGANVVLTTGHDGSILWSKEFEQPSGRIPDLKQQIAFTTARVIGCAAEGLAAAEPLGEANLKIYLNACGGMSDALTDSRSTVRALERLVQSSPRFVPGWAMLLDAELAVVGDPRMPEGRALIPMLKRHMAEARELEPHLAEAYMAELFLMPESDFVGRGQLLDEAVRHNPEHRDLRLERGRLLHSVGRSRDALQDVREAVKLDPLSPAAREVYIVSLAIAGRMDAAQQELHAAERLWPGSSSLANARYILHLRWGDPHEALRIMQAQQITGRTPDVHEPFLRARIQPTPDNIEKALRHGRMVLREVPESISVYSQMLAEFDRKEELLGILASWRRMDIVTYITDVLFRPQFSGLHRDRRFMQVAQHLGLLNYWRTTGEWPDFCYAADLPYDCKTEAGKVVTVT